MSILLTGSEIEALEIKHKPQNGPGSFMAYSRAIQLALIEKMRKEPVGWRVKFNPPQNQAFSQGLPTRATIDYWEDGGLGIEYCYTTPHEAIIATEQRVAEACAEYARSGAHDDDPYIMARGMESGEWRKYL